MDPDALTVCVAHGRFIPCRKHGEHRYTQNPYWVKSVRDYQTSTIEGLTWEPAWPTRAPAPATAPTSQAGTHAANDGAAAATTTAPRAHT